MSWYEESRSCHKCKNLDVFNIKSNTTGKDLRKYYCKYIQKFVDWDVYQTYCDRGFEDYLT